jgi:tRNA threonylcarbamoyladenosine biosynthesis protein TsaE
MQDSKISQLKYREEQIGELAAFLLSLRSDTCLIALEGPLGAGKTRVVRAVAKLCKLEGEVSSPSYSLQHIYQNSEFRIEHWDLYRVEKAPLELLEEASGLVFIEWASKDDEVLSECQYKFRFEILSEDERVVHCTGLNAEQLESFLNCVK